MMVKEEEWAFTYRFFGQKLWFFPWGMDYGRACGPEAAWLAALRFVSSLLLLVEPAYFPSVRYESYDISESREIHQLRSLALPICG